MKTLRSALCGGLLCASGQLMAAEEETQAISSFADVIEAGGWPMYVIIAFSAIALCLVIYYLLAFRAGILFPRRFMQEAAEAADRGDAEALKVVCRMHNSSAAKIMHAATEQMTATKRLDYMAVRDAIEDEGSRQAGMLWQRLQYLMDVAVIAPMVGLLGTVLGMLRSFAVMETELGAVRPASLSQGVAQALITTAAGLIVGITAMILYALFRGRVSQLVARMEEACSLLLRKLAENYSSAE